MEHEHENNDWRDTDFAPDYPTAPAATEALLLATHAADERTVNAYLQIAADELRAKEIARTYPRPSRPSRTGRAERYPGGMSAYAQDRAESHGNDAGMGDYMYAQYVAQQLQLQATAAAN